MTRFASMSLLVFCVFAFGIAPAAGAVPDADFLGGRLEAKTASGETVVFPTLRTEVEAEVAGDLATVTVVQTFLNPGDEAMNATYLFPLSRDAAVYAMEMEVGDERVRAVIRRVEEARKTFEAAKREGRSAALLVQHRPNMFTQDVANLMPGLPIRVTLRYVQTVPRVDGDYELVIPLVVGPRFQPAGAGEPPAESFGHEGPAGGAPELFDEGPRDPLRSASAKDAGEAPGSGGAGTAGDGGPLATSRSEGGVPRWSVLAPPAAAGGATHADSRTAFGQWEVEQLPLYPPVHGLDIPDSIDSGRVSLAVEIDGGMPIRRVESATHGIATAVLAPERWRVALDTGDTIANRDFVLRYALSGESVDAGLLSWRDDRGGFFSLLVEPPAAPADAAITRREMVFVLDCSGSMAGLPMEASKAFMREALRNLRPTDTFRIIRFSDAATEFSTRPLEATPDNVLRGLAYTDQLHGSGGTMMTSGIRQAFAPPVPKGAVRLVTFLTDGYIGNEHEILRLLDAEIGAARLFAFGVGTGVNRYLLDEMGRAGRGFTRYMDPTDDVGEVSRALAQRLQSPVLTDVEIEWGDLRPLEVSPDPIPDLFAGDSLRLQGRYDRPGTFEIRVHGKVAGAPATLPLRVELPESGGSSDAVALVWARSAIRESMRRISTPARFRTAEARSVDDLKDEVIRLGLSFSLVTQWTSFVAVSEKIVNRDPDGTPTRPVPLQQVKGVSELAYGKPGALAAGSPQLVAQATPEPATMLGLALVSLLLIAVLRRPAAEPGRLR